MIFKRAKIIALLFAFLFINYFTQDFTLINIEKTALIVTLGIDKDKDKYSVTAQIAVPEGNKQQTTNNESVITSSGKTVYEAVSNIGDNTGWYPKLSFCNLIVLGESVLNENVMNVLDFFIRSYKVEDSAILCACQGEAKELLLSSSPLDNISGLSLSKIFVKEYEGASRVLTTTIRDFCINFYSRSQYGYMPFVKTILTDESGIGGKTASASSLSEPSSGSAKGSGGDTQKFVIYDANTCLLFNQGYMCGEISNDETLCYSLLYKRVKEAFLPIKATDIEGNNGEILINILRTSNKVELIYENDKPILYLYLKVWSRVIDTNFSEDIDTISDLGKLTENMRELTANIIKDKIINIVNIAKASGCDIFGVKNLLYKRHFSKYKKDNIGILDKVDVKIDVYCLNYV